MLIFTILNRVRMNVKSFSNCSYLTGLQTIFPGSHILYCAFSCPNLHMLESVLRNNSTLVHKYIRNLCLKYVRYLIEAQELWNGSDCRTVEGHGRGGGREEERGRGGLPQKWHLSTRNFFQFDKLFTVLLISFLQHKNQTQFN